MRILIYTHAFPPMIGGVESITMALARGLADWPKTHPDSPIEVVVATKTPAGAMDDSSLPFGVVREPTLRDLVSLIRSADVVHLAGPAFLPLLLGYLLRKTVFVEHHGYQSICPNGVLIYQLDKSVCPGHFMKGRYQNCLRCESRVIGWTASLRNILLTFPRRWLCAWIAANIAVSNHVARRIALPRTTTIYHGIDDVELSRSAATVSNGDQLNIGYVGRFVEGKGLPSILIAAQLLRASGRHFHLTLVGDGPLRENLERQVENLGLKGLVTFTGLLSGARLQDALGSVHVVVLPSECEETAGLAAMEQMMRGGVVVAADIGGLGEVVGDSGIRFKPGDSASLASHLMELQDDASLQDRLRSEARKRAVQLFSREAMVSQHLSCYRNAKSRIIG